MANKIALNIYRTIETVETVEADLTENVRNGNLPKNAAEKAVLDELSEILRVDDMADGRSPIGIPLADDRYLTCEVGNASKEGSVYTQWISCRDEQWAVGNDHPYIARQSYRLFEISSQNNPDYVGNLSVRDNPRTPEIETSAVKVYEYTPKVERERP